MEDAPIKAEPSATPASVVAAHQLTVTQVPAVYTDEAHAVYSKYQQKVHGDSPSQVKPSAYKRFLCNSTLQVTAHSHPTDTQHSQAPLPARG